MQAEFQKTLAFDLDVAKSAGDPAHPVSHLGITTKPFYLKSDDTYKFGLPEANFTFRYSYGDPQPVQVLALRSLGAVTVKWKVNGGDDADRYDVTSGAAARSTTRARAAGTTSCAARSPGTNPGDSVEVWFEAGGLKSPSFTYQAVNESTNDVLDPRGRGLHAGLRSSASGSGRRPSYLSFYQDALTANQHRVRRLRRRRPRPQGADLPRRPQPLQGGRLVHGRRRRHA